jgi:hypothetical protein
VLLYVRFSLLIVPVEFHQVRRAARPAEYRRLGNVSQCMYTSIYRLFP